MRYKVFLNTILLVVLSFNIFSQEYYINDYSKINSSYANAMDAFNAGNYTTSAQLFNKIYTKNNFDDATFNDKASVLYYLGTSYKKTGDYYFAQKYYTILLNNYPASIYCNNTLFELAEIKFINKDYREAINMYSKVNTKLLSSYETDKYYFNLGYSYLRTKKLTDAADCFYKIKDSSKDFGSAASYYFAHILFEIENYNEALAIFEQLKYDPIYGVDSQHYILRILSIKNDYEEIAKLATSLPKSNNKRNNKETDAIIAEAYYKTKQYDKAIPLLEEVVLTNPNPTFYYYLGESYYQNNLFEKALKNFEKVANYNSEIGQNASFYVGLCNLKLDNLNFAANAFYNSYRLDFNKNITEASLFNYANTVYETGFDPYNEAINGLQKYINENPNSPRENEAKTLLANLFLATKNFQNALQIINNIDIKSDNLKLAHQKITFSRATDFFIEKDYNRAYDLYKESQKYGLDVPLNAQTQYWLGECNYRMGKYALAINDFKKFTNMKRAIELNIFEDSFYSLGYCYFKQKNYSEARNYFNRYINTKTNLNKAKTCDAWNRIGDCHFISKNFTQAIEAYDKAINMYMDMSGYPQYYKALALGAKGDLAGKANILKSIENMPTSAYYRSNALFELGNNYNVMEEPELAIDAYKTLIREYPKSPYNIKAKQKIGLLYFGMNMLDDATIYFKDIIESYPGSIEAKESLATLKNIYITQNNVDDYFNYVQTNTHINISVSEADSLSFSSAQNLFASSNYDKAKKQLYKYVNDFPNGAFLGTAYYYLGECFYMEKNYDEALDKFMLSLNYPNSIYSENAKIQIANIYYLNEDYNSAIKVYKDVINTTSYDYIAKDASINLMRSYYNNFEYENLLNQANKVLTFNNLDDKTKTEAQFCKAYGLYGLGKFNEAYNNFSEVAKKSKNVVSAESKYFCAFINYINGNYDKAEKESFELINTFGHHDFWVARGFILLGDIYVKTGNTFQAKQTYQSIIDNYVGDDLKEEAQQKLNLIPNNE